MTLTFDQLKLLQCGSPEQAWEAIATHAWNICSAPLAGTDFNSEVARRDRELSDIDLFLATAGWDLWSHFESSLPHTADALADWWSRHGPGKAVLVLDALSLREAPWILEQAAARGFTVHQAMATAAELPADTTQFARALGFQQRSALGANGVGGNHRFPGARTETADLAWEDSASFVDSQPDWFFWHHWPDKDVHDLADAGEGLRPMTTNAAVHLQCDAFWKLVGRLAEGRRLIITSDHGYAASDGFPDAPPDQSEYLKHAFKSGRSVADAPHRGPWIPPIDLLLETRHGRHLLVNGRRKWKSAGGYPTLTHGGLSVLEVLSPFIELSKKGGA